MSPRGVEACLLAALSCAGCTSMQARAALASTVPMESLSTPVMLGDARGSACQSDILGLFSLEKDSSVATAKARALASVQRPQAATALIDVSIDEERYITFVYNRRCTVIRGRALGSSAQRDGRASSF